LRHQLFGAYEVKKNKEKTHAGAHLREVKRIKKKHMQARI
jgi:hypothetical protein